MAQKKRELTISGSKAVGDAHVSLYLSYDMFLKLLHSRNQD